MQQNHDPADLIRLFNDIFEETYQTRLVWGGEEPVYLPANPPDRSFHEIHFAHGFFASALHEIAHWMVAGPARRQLEDFGYWYIPDGRNAEQQARFEAVEVRPQAIEWILSRACRKPFRVSVDNLSGDAGDPSGFRQNIHAEVQQLMMQGEEGLPERLQLFVRACREFYQVEPLSAEDFVLEEIL